jgi:CheY-like chemotaxis protein
MLGLGSGSIYLAGEFARNPRVDLPHDTESAETQRNRPRVLVVDDEKLIADTCAEIFEGAGFYAKTAYDGWAALQMAEEFHPDYLLTDVLMPRMNGVELAIAISKMLPATKILLFSGQAGISQIMLDGHNRGYEFELIAKPVHPLKLIESLRRT